MNAPRQLGDTGEDAPLQPGEGEDRPARETTIAAGDVLREKAYRMPEMQQRGVQLYGRMTSRTGSDDTTRQRG